MFGESDWTAQVERLNVLRQEAAVRRLVCRSVRVNLWARLLPRLRRLEAWMERHAGSTDVASSRAARARAR